MLRIALRHAGSFHYADDHNHRDDDHNDEHDDCERTTNNLVNGLVQTELN